MTNGMDRLHCYLYNQTTMTIKYKQTTMTNGIIRLQSLTVWTDYNDHCLVRLL